MFWITQLDLSHQAWLRRSQPHYWKPGAWGSLSRVTIREGKTGNLFQWGLHTSRHHSSLHIWLPSSAGANTSLSTIRARCLLPSSLCSQDSCSAPPPPKPPTPPRGQDFREHGAQPLLVPSQITACLIPLQLRSLYQAPNLAACF